MTWNNAKIREKLKQKKGTRNGANPKKDNAVCWEEIPGAEITSALDYICNAGGCLRFGVSRDRATYSIGFYLGDTYFTDYFRDIAECREFLAHIPDMIKMVLSDQPQDDKKQA